MPLPPALLARLKRRKIIQEVDEDPSNEHGYEDDQPTDENTEKQTKIEQDDDQKKEILAEDYSDESESQDEQNDRNETLDGDKDDSSGPYQEIGQEMIQEVESLARLVADGESVIGCPNKYNFYHACEKYCLDNYGKLESTEPSLEQRKLLATILKTFPIPDDWVIVFEPQRIDTLGQRIIYVSKCQSNAWKQPEKDIVILNSSFIIIVLSSMKDDRRGRTIKRKYIY